MIPGYEKTKSYVWFSCLSTVSLFGNFILMAIPPYPHDILVEEVSRMVGSDYVFPCRGKTVLYARGI